MPKGWEPPKSYGAAKNILALASEDFELLRQDDSETHLYDKVVDKVYIYNRAAKSWKFPAGSRVEVIALLTGVDL